VFYECQRCGNCCRWPGHVRLTEGDIDRLCERMGLGAGDFTREFTDLHPQRDGLVLKSHPDGRCVFLEGENVCRVQDAKPEQCQGFPNRWRFPGWRRWCEAIPAEKVEKRERVGRVRRDGQRS